MTREEANQYRTGDGYYELKFSEAEMRDAFNDGFLVAINQTLEIIDRETCCGRLNARVVRAAVEALRGEQE